MTLPLAVIALDGHDGSGKSTLALQLAEQLGSAYLRPFGGTVGARLMAVGSRGDLDATIAVGHDALDRALAAADADRSLVLDRSWMTVASFFSWDVFAPRWSLWIPTVLCWTDLATTIARLDQRDDADRHQPIDWHRTYVERYLDLAQRSRSPVLDTTRLPPDEALRQLKAMVRQQWDGACLKP